MLHDIMKEQRWDFLMKKIIIRFSIILILMISNISFAEYNHDLMLKFLNNKDAYSAFQELLKSNPDSEDQVILGKFYYMGVGTEQDYKKAYLIFDKFSKKGNAEAQYYLGSMYWDGNGVEKNISKGKELVTLAAKNKNPSAQFRLGALAWGGDGSSYFSVDYPAALYWLSQVTNNPDASHYSKATSYFMLGDIYANGPNELKNLSKAIQFYTLAALNNNIASQIRLGVIYFSTTNGQNNLEKAEYWLEKAANKNNAAAKYLLFKLYINKDFSHHDTTKAINLLKSSSDQGYPPAQANLCTFLILGKYVTQNYSQAFELCQNAAKNGNPLGQMSLGTIYYEGLGASQNIVLAYVWLSIAASRGEENAEKLRDIVQSHMNSEQINQAQALSQIYDEYKDTSFSLKWIEQGQDLE